MKSVSDWIFNAVLKTIAAVLTTIWKTGNKIPDWAWKMVALLLILGSIMGIFTL